MSAREQHFFELGKKTGRKELLDEIHKALGIDEAIAQALTLHEEQSHEDRP